jgi:hypothetical protein
MSVDFIITTKVSATDLFSGILEPFGIRELVKRGITCKARRCLDNGQSYVWVTLDNNGFVECLTSYGFCDPRKILFSIEKALNVRIELDPLFENWKRACELEKKGKRAPGHNRTQKSTHSMR